MPRTRCSQESIRNKDNPLFIRRVKEDLKDFEGRPLFLPRHVKTMPFNLGTESPSEKDLYNDLSRYVNTQYNRALTKDRRRNVAFALVILQRRLASSTYALLPLPGTTQESGWRSSLKGAQEQGQLDRAQTFDSGSRRGPERRGALEGRRDLGNPQRGREPGGTGGGDRHSR